MEISAFSPGANPGHGRDVSGALASLNSVASMSFADCRDGISNTFSIIPRSLGKSEKEKAKNLVGLLDAYFEKRGFHLNVNVLDRDMLEDAMKHPEVQDFLCFFQNFCSIFLKLFLKNHRNIQI